MMNRRTPMVVAIIATLALWLGACSGESSEDAGPALPFDWSFEGATYSAQSGIAGHVPDIWVEEGWSAGGILVYLSDQDLTCDQFPRVKIDRFPPLPTEMGAMIWLKFKEANPGSALDYASFDIVESGASSGAGISAAEASLSLVDTDDAKRVVGQLDYDSRDTDATPTIQVSGSFDVPFCG